MNLVTGAWIPAMGSAGHRHISLRELLCTENDWRLALPRDDMELACQQLLVALVQVLWTPKNKLEWRQRLDRPFAYVDFDKGIEQGEKWFDLEESEQPFMQRKKVEVEKATTVQKLFAGLPAGNSHAFFNRKDEIRVVCPGCAAMALFNQCTNAPNISGKHKGGLRGGAPICKMVWDASLRKRIWCNVLHEQSLSAQCSLAMAEEAEKAPVWVKSIKAKEQIHVGQIGLTRGLFWTPILVRLIAEEQPCVCDCCGLPTQRVYRSLMLGADFKFEVKADKDRWPHPWTPREAYKLKKSKKGKDEGASKPAAGPLWNYVSFKTTAPAWTQCSQYLFEKKIKEGEGGNTPAPVVAQFQSDSYDPLQLSVGGYRTHQASVLQRRHELIALPAQWRGEASDYLQDVVRVGLSALAKLKGVLGGVSKGIKDYHLSRGDKIKVKGLGLNLPVIAEQRYYARTEALMLDALSRWTAQEDQSLRQTLIRDLRKVCMNLFEEQVAPYRHEPELIRLLAIHERKLLGALAQLAAAEKPVEEKTNP